MIKGFLTCLPFVAVLGAWLGVYWTRRTQPLHPPSLIALLVLTANAALAAGAFAYYKLRPAPSLPPWQDPEILTFAWLFLLAPVGIVFGFLAFRSSARWLFWLVEIVSVWLFFVGCLAGLAV